MNEKSNAEILALWKNSSNPEYRAIVADYMACKEMVRAISAKLNTDKSQLTKSVAENTIDAFSPEICIKVVHQARLDDQNNLQLEKTLYTSVCEFFPDCKDVACADYPNWKKYAKTKARLTQMKLEFEKVSHQLENYK
ncbi:MAG: hypothetical protein J5608_01115 [Alphaproteobacteria bacterium]|nr:hypothetical protein [Alphaproteobacteria bacterium]